MDWAKAKTYIILSLFLLNVFLLGLNFMRFQRYGTKAEDVEYTRDILEKSNVKINCNLPTQYSPMQNFMLKKYNHDYVILKNIFFDEQNDIKQTFEFEDRILYDNDGNKLTSSDNVITFEASYYDKSRDEIISDITSEIFKNYCVMEKVYDNTSDNVRTVAYNQEYNGYILFNNILSFTFYENNYKIKFAYCEPANFSGNKSELYSPCEAIFDFSKEIKKLYDIESYEITDMKIGYWFDIGENSHESTYCAVPCYRICVKSIEDSFYINALNNTFYYTAD